MYNLLKARRLTVVNKLEFTQKLVRMSLTLQVHIIAAGIVTFRCLREGTHDELV